MRKKNAQEVFKKTKNCATAVLDSFKDKHDLDPEILKQITAGFAGGMYSADTCGAVTGAVMVISMLKSNNSKINFLEKRDLSKTTNRFMKKFKEKNNSTNCKELKSVHKIKCDILVENAVEILEEILE